MLRTHFDRNAAFGGFQAKTGGGYPPAPGAAAKTGGGYPGTQPKAGRSSLTLAPQRPITHILNDGPGGYQTYSPTSAQPTQQPSFGTAYNPQQPGSAGPGGFESYVTGFDGQRMDPSQFFAQRGAFVQAINDWKAPHAQAFGQSGTPIPKTPLADLWKQAGEMVQGGWTNPFAAQPTMSQDQGTPYGQNPPRAPRFGQSIGTDGVRSTMQFIDSDRDGVDDRDQRGPGMPNERQRGRPGRPAMPVLRAPASGPTSWMSNPGMFGMAPIAQRRPPQGMAY